MTAPRLVYLLKAGERTNEELRYSLRSMEANLPHDGVTIVGMTRGPSWLSEDVERVFVRDGSRKWDNLPRALRAAGESVPGDFLYCNDDFFIMQPLAEMPVMHRGILQEGKGYIRNTGSYSKGYRETEKLLRQLDVGDPMYNYELHVPLPVNGERLAEAIRRAQAVKFRGRCLQTRTLYGNLWGIGGEEMGDVKVFRGDSDKPVVSTNDLTFKREPIGKRIRAAFPNPSKYERTA